MEDISNHAAGQGKWNLFEFSAVCYMLPICGVKPVRKLVGCVSETDQIEEGRNAATWEWFVCPGGGRYCAERHIVSDLLLVLFCVNPVLVLHDTCQK